MSAWDDFIVRHKVEDVVPGIVTSVTDGFATVDLGGVEGRISAQDVAWSHGPCFPFVGSHIHSAIISFDHEAERVGITGDIGRSWAVWKDAESRFPPGSRHRAVVRVRLTYGVFAAVAPGIEGLILEKEVRKLPALCGLPRFPVEHEPVEVDVVVESINPRKMQLSLVLPPDAEVLPPRLTPPPVE